MIWNRVYTNVNGVHLVFFCGVKSRTSRNRLAVATITSIFVIVYYILLQFPMNYYMLQWSNIFHYVSCWWNFTRLVVFLHNEIRLRITASISEIWSNNKRYLLKEFTISLMSLCNCKVYILINKNNLGRILQ